MAKIPSNPRIAIIGLGYVGLPLAVAFAQKYQTLGFDINSERVNALNRGVDTTGEVSADELKASTNLSIVSDQKRLAEVDVFIVTVPTPVDTDKRPDLGPLRSASEMVGAAIKKDGVVIYESTVYPGATEEVCVPIIERISGLVFNVEFFAGYSPERINPGDKEHRIGDIIKVTSGSTPDIAKQIDALYGSIITAGTHLAPSIKVAEAAKVIENTQRDLNIALVNELAIIFNKLEIDTSDVLAAAATKWNFLPFKPGLVGGHCIGVDPYYLTHKAERIGYRPEVILAGRRINDGMSHYVVKRIVKLMIKKGINVSQAKLLVLGLTFKENCPDVRNSKVVDMVNEFIDYGMDVDVFDPVADKDAAWNQHGIKLHTQLEGCTYDAIVLAVAHTELLVMSDKFNSYRKQSSVVFDIKNILPSMQRDECL